MAAAWGCLSAHSKLAARIETRGVMRGRTREREREGDEEEGGVRSRRNAYCAGMGAGVRVSSIGKQDGVGDALIRRGRGGARARSVTIQVMRERSAGRADADGGHGRGGRIGQVWREGGEKGKEEAGKDERGNGRGGARREAGTHRTSFPISLLHRHLVLGREGK
ncbi:hypothetical protein B0H13DRAFT_1877360 [Mycena leptocephala]|nr:hypothetical protein B0H13DRAFT_1877360 [Mycena leptocephala]